MTYPTADELTAAGLTLDSDGPVVTVTLDRPERRNAQTPATWRALAAIGAAIGPDVRAVVVRANGPSFCTGLDRAMLTPDGIAGETTLAQIAALSDRDAQAVIAGYQAGFTWLRDPRFISVAAVQGHAVGAGFQLALGCDLRILAEDAVLCMREPALGLVPDLAGTHPLVQSVGYSRALEICATGRWVAADDAAAIGLATAVVPHDELRVATDDLVAAVLQAPHAAVTATTGLLQQAASRSYEHQCAAEREAQVLRIRDLVRRQSAG
ncbi:MAG: enoyl-CoA hydratase/isomerase family protein [Nocardioidaceae bacterium]|nr:enoyl-CoA hydratase/isomerase family protein [Nocardioidaceae bacterium]